MVVVVVVGGGPVLDRIRKRRRTTAIIVVVVGGTTAVRICRISLDDAVVATTAVVGAVGFTTVLLVSLSAGARFGGEAVAYHCPEDSWCWYRIFRMAIPSQE